MPYHVSEVGSTAKEIKHVRTCQPVTIMTDYNYYHSTSHNMGINNQPPVVASQLRLQI